jgi:hypothetical protein
VHPQVRPQLEAAIEADQQVLAVRLDGIDATTDQSMHLWHRSRPLGAGRRDIAAHEMRRAGSPKAYPFGHRRAAGLSARRAGSAAIAGDDPASSRRWRVGSPPGHRLRITRSFARSHDASPRRGRHPDLEGGEGLERGPATLEVERGDAVHEDDVGARRPLERAAIRLATSRPRQGGAVRIRGIGGGQQVDDGDAARLPA